MVYSIFSSSYTSVDSKTNEKGTTSTYYSDYRANQNPDGSGTETFKRAQNGEPPSEVTRTYGRDGVLSLSTCPGEQKLIDEGKGSSCSPFDSWGIGSMNRKRFRPQLRSSPLPPWWSRTGGTGPCGPNFFGDWPSPLCFGAAGAPISVSGTVSDDGLEDSVARSHVPAPKADLAD